MNGDLVVRFRVGRGEILGALACGLLVLVPLPLDSQGTGSQSVAFNTFFPAPVGAFSELAVTGGPGAPQHLLLARDSGGVGIGDIGAAAPADALVVFGGVSLGGSTAVPGAEALNISDGGGGLSSVAMANRVGGGGWSLYGNRQTGTDTLWVSSFTASGGGPYRMLGLESGSSFGSLQVSCLWGTNGCPAGHVSLFHGNRNSAGGAASPGDLAQHCNNLDNNPSCMPNPAASLHMCCRLRAP